VIQRSGIQNLTTDEHGFDGLSVENGKNAQTATEPGRSVLISVICVYQW
jgi:hypothetical protein